jgi:hypothetical protein
MPALWRRCLNGEDPIIDLRGARLLAEHQYLWATRAPTSRLAAFFASKLMRGRMEKVAGAGCNDSPMALRHPAFQGTVYRLDEPILDVASVLSIFAERYRDAIVRSQGPVTLKADGTITLHYPNRPSLVVRPTCTVFTAGAGNAALPWATLQRRPCTWCWRVARFARGAVRALSGCQRSAAPDRDQPLRRQRSVDLVSRRRTG